MRTWLRPSRRNVLTSFLAMAVGSAGAPADAQSEPPGDRGIGGTGVAPDEKESDRGIGGTGVIGTIRRFGSIEVNGLRITFPRAVQVRIDGRRARLPDLRLGHVVRVLALRRRERLETQRIEAWSEVVGPIEAETVDGWQVLGQRVIVGGGGRRLQAGDVVAVSGLRRLDGTIVASLVERRASRQCQVAGAPRLDREGVARIGGLPLLGLPSDLLGRRVLLTGSLSNDAFVVERFGIEPFGLRALRPARFSIEDYVALQDGNLQLGSGLAVSGNGYGATAASGEEVRAVISATIGPDDRLTVQAVRPEGGGRGSPGDAPQGPHPFGPKPESFGPAQFGGPSFGPPGPNGSQLGGFGPTPPGASSPGADPTQSPGPGGFGVGPSNAGPSGGPPSAGGPHGAGPHGGPGRH